MAPLTTAIGNEEMGKVSFNIFLALLTASLGSLSIHAETIDRHVSARYVKKIISLSEEKNHTSSFETAGPQDGYLVTIEKLGTGLIGPGFEVEKELGHYKLGGDLGIDADLDFSFTNTKKVKTLKEAHAFIEMNALDYFQAAKVLKMEEGETVTFDLVAGMLMDATAKGAGGSVIIKGGWDIEVTKKEKDVVSVEFSLINSQMVSAIYDNFEATFSYDLGAFTANGFTIELNLKDAMARESYKRIFQGNILFAQEQSISNRNVLFLKHHTSKKKVHGTSFGQTSPVLAWFFLNSSNYLGTENKMELSYTNNSKEESFVASYEEDTQLDFIGLYVGGNRTFSVEHNLENKKFEIMDHYETEGNSGDIFNASLKRMLFKTRMGQYFDLNVPKGANSFYNIKFDVIYSESFLRHIISGDINLRALNGNAKKNIQVYFDSKIAEAKKFQGNYASDRTFALIRDKQFEDNLVDIGTHRMLRHSGKMQEAWAQGDLKAVIENFSVMMKYIYNSPELYRQFVDYAKHCGLEINTEISSAAFAKKRTHEVFIKDAFCTQPN
jgi:hypothetical protein